MGILQIANYAGPFFIVIYLTHILDMETYGVVALSVSVVQSAIIFLDFGFGLSATKKISQYRDDKFVVGKLIGAIFFIKSVLFIFICLCLCLFIFSTKKYDNHLVLFGLSIIPILGQGFQPDWFYLGIERMRYITMFSILARIISIVAIVILISPNHYYLVPVANGFAQIIATTLFINKIYELGYKIYLPSRTDLKETFLMTMPFFASRLAVMGYTNGATILLGIFSTQTSIALYSVGEQIYKAFQTMFSPITQALYPYMVKEKNIIFFYKMLFAAILVSVSLSTLGYFFIPILLPHFFKADFGLVIPILNIFFLAIPFHTVSVLVGYPLAAIFGLESIANKSVFFGVLTYFLGALIAWKFGQLVPVTLAWLTFFTELTVMVYRLLKFYSKLLDPK